MRSIVTILTAGGLSAAMGLGFRIPVTAGGSHAGDHGHGSTEQMTVDEMRQMHEDHKHGHDFEAMAEMPPEKQARVMALMHEIGVAVPPMDPARGRQLFVEKGCIACHAVNGIGGDVGPTLNAEDMPRPMNAFEFAARMWRGAEAMTEMQQDLFGEVISLDGQDRGDLVAFAHDAEEQARLTEDQIPEQYRKLIAQ